MFLENWLSLTPNAVRPLFHFAFSIGQGSGGCEPGTPFRELTLTSTFSLTAYHARRPDDLPRETGRGEPGSGTDRRSALVSNRSLPDLA